MAFAHDFARSHLEVAVHALHAVGKLIAIQHAAEKAKETDDSEEFEELLHILISAAEKCGTCRHDASFTVGHIMRSEFTFAEGSGNLTVNLKTGKVSKWKFGRLV